MAFFNFPITYIGFIRFTKQFCDSVYGNQATKLESFSHGKSSANTQQTPGTWSTGH